MADEQQTVAEGGRQSGLMKELSNAAAKKALAPIAATAATAGTVYVTRKSTEIWQKRVLPKVREKGGGKALARETLEKTAERLGGRSAEALSELAKRLGDAPSDDRPRSEAKPAEVAQESTAQESTAQESPVQPSDPRDQQRKKRQQRRQQRQRALEKSGST
jgi:hypothetical protein